jgi:4-aminobutyrate aminotransferase-like enzyme/Ser/Thr protein kinase RdoA (MazF antagonist)
MNKPELSDLSKFLEEQFQIKANVSQLAGYQDQNYLATCSSGKKYILKITTENDDLEFIRSQNRILYGLSKQPLGILLPCPISNIKGVFISELSIGESTFSARLFPFIAGEFLGESKPDIHFFFELGKAFGQMDAAMSGMEDAVLKCRTHEWDLSRVLEVMDDINLIKNPADRRLVHFYLMKYREEVLPVFHKLQKMLIHGDGNDWNILVGRGSEVAGIIDFGDMVWGPRINEVAIVLAYALMGREDFIEVYHELINGYREIIELEEIELSLLYYLVAARWCQTIVMAARQSRDNKESDYHQVSVKGAREMLHLWVRQNPIKKAEEVKIAEEVKRRYQYFSKSVSLSYQEPIHMVGGAMQYMYSSDGRTYLDCVNNIPHVGHCHPKVVEAGQKQMARLNTNTRYLYGSIDRYAEKLLSKFPSSLNKIFFVNSGSAATDLAVRLAESFTGQSEYLVLDYAYHGNTKAAVGLSPYKFNRKGGKGKPENVTILDVPPPGQLLRVQEPPPGPLLRKEGGQDPRTFFAESIVGCAGQIVLSKEFMQQTVNGVRSEGGIYIADEVQTGFGRVGHKFWGYELYDVVPDMVILGKPMGNGHPMGAVVCTEAIARSFETGMEFFSSYGGNPVSCEIGLAVLDVIEEEGLQENARQVGDYLLNQLAVSSLQSSVFSRQSAAGSKEYRVAEVRGSGLFLGIELRENGTDDPATEAAVNIVNAMKESGFLLSTDGPFNNVIKFKPPLCFSMENAKELILNLKRWI